MGKRSRSNKLERTGRPAEHTGKAVPWDEQGASDVPMTTVTRRLVREFIAPHWRVLAVGLAAMTFVAATTGALPYLMKLVADEILQGKNEALLYTLPLAILVVMTSRAVADWISRVADAWLRSARR